MTETAIDIIETMLESALEDTDDSNIRFKLRTALQLLVVIEEQQEAGREALKDVEIQDDVRENLRELGYLDQ